MMIVSIYEMAKAVVFSSGTRLSGVPVPFYLEKSTGRK